MLSACAKDKETAMETSPGSKPKAGWHLPIRGRLDKVDRLLAFLAAVAVLSSLALPIWWIHLWAPQYPGGLNILIHARDLTGDIQNVNILNHYIGMKPLSVEAFPEFLWLTPVLAGLGALLLLVAVVGRMELVWLGFLAMLSFDLYMLYDLSFWLHDWGYKLDPRAPITVAPFMPPVLGFKKIANFVVYSIPSFGGIGVMVATFLLPVLSWFHARRSA